MNIENSEPYIPIRSAFCCYHLRFASISMLAFWSLSMSGFSVEPDDKLIQLTGRIRVILEKKCAKCHGPELEEPDGDFGDVLDLPKLVETPELIVPKDPKRSELYRIVREGEMPPPEERKDIPRLTPDEVNAFRMWILAGAPTLLPKVLPEYVEVFDSSQITSAIEDLQTKAKRKRLSIEMVKKPAGEIVAELRRLSEMEIDYNKPEIEPVLTIRLKQGTLYEAVSYIALNGDFSLTFTNDRPRIGPNPPPELPIEPPPIGKVDLYPK
jgi:mono/diheme cytochrome c family protein